MNLDDFIKIVHPYTMTNIERIESLYNSLEYIRINNILGDIVECGVWKGGNILGCLEYFNYHKMNNNVWLYDTFSGMTQTTAEDLDHNGNKGEIWVGKCDCSLDEVKKIIDVKKYKNNEINFIVGDVLDTLSNEDNKPKKISILRLDTDWYLSTKMELETLYSRLTDGGVLIVDDYGHWDGSRKAVDEYFDNNKIEKTFLQIDYTAIKYIK